jgi:YYY domain-containing protein
MGSFFFWYFLITILGWLTFPLAYTLFPALADRGYTLSRAAGLLIWSYLFWLFASLGVAQNDTGGIMLALVILVVLSAISIVYRPQGSSIVDFVKTNLALILTTEILFLAAFSFLAFVRSANPELISTEKPMELAFINGILRSPAFPPQDPWLSGYAISYYYFGYVMTAMLARLSNINGSMAHNLMLSLIFALGAVGSYGILYNLLTQLRITNYKLQIESHAPRPMLLALLSPLFLLLVSNFEALLEVLHRNGFFWAQDPITKIYTSNFWSWLDMKELSSPPMIPFQWTPDRYLWWWRGSRVIQDYDMLRSPREVIDEFPLFSFLLGDLHPHVLAIPFSLLAIAVALNLFLDTSDEKVDLFGLRLHISYPRFLFSALVIGGLAFLNTWDILIAGTLIVFAYVFSRANADGWRWDRLEDIFLLCLPLAFLSIILYLPFYFGFSSQAGGILPNMMFVTRGAHLWVMWGTLFIPIFAYLFSGTPNLASASDNESSNPKRKPNWKLAFSLGFGIALFLWAFSWFIGWVGSYIEQDYVIMFLASQGMTAAEFFNATSLRRLEYIGSLITLLAIFIPALAFLFPRHAVDDKPQTADDGSPSIVYRQPSANQFVLLLITLAALLVLAPEFVYLRDQFGYRINTVFKFYYQAWMLWSLAAAFGTAYLLQNLKGVRDILFRVVISLVIFAGLLYPIFGLMNKTNNFKPLYGFTLDDFDRIKRENPDEAAAIDFLRTVPNGIIAEAVGDGYSSYGRISANTGLQTILGWPGHEAQWRGSYEPQGSRRDDMTQLYSTFYWEEAQIIMEKYDIRYIYIGTLEQTSMRVNEEKFKSHLKVIFQQGNVTIYEAP